jgi:hypothetical protein
MYNVIIIETKALCIGDLSRYWLSCLGPLVYFLKNILNYLTFQPFDFERTWWRLFQKRVVHTKFDIYFFISAHDLFLEFPDR